MELITLDVDANEAPDRTIVGPFEACQESMLKVEAYLISGEAEEQIVHVKDQVNRVANRRRVREESIGAIDSGETVSEKKLLQGVSPGFGCDGKPVEWLDELPDVARSVVAARRRADVEFRSRSEIVSLAEGL